MMWRPICELEDGIEAILFEPENKAKYRDGGMVIGTVHRSAGTDGLVSMAVRVSCVSGYEWECDVEHPTLWAPKPAAP
jgi:hypothetical protein